MDKTIPRADLRIRDHVLGTALAALFVMRLANSKIRHGFKKTDMLIFEFLSTGCDKLGAWLGKWNPTVGLVPATGWK